jgi:hypothetical protein
MKTAIIFITATILSIFLSKKWVDATSGSDELKIERFSHENRQPTVQLESILVEHVKTIGSVVGASKDQTKLSNDDLVYLKLPQRPVSPGDVFFIVEESGGVKVPGSAFSNVGKQVRVKASARITRVLPTATEAKIFDARMDVTRGDKLMEVFPLHIEIKPREPKVDVRGQVLASSAQVGIIGSYDFAFVNLGRRDGLEINDRLAVFVSGDNNPKITKGLPEITVAETVVVHLDEKFATVYVLSSRDAFEAGAAIKSDRKLVRFLEDSPVPAAQGPSN